MKTGLSYHFRLVAALLVASCGPVLAQQTAPMQPAPPEPGMQPANMPPGGMPPAELPRPGSLNYVQGEVASAGQPLSPQSVGRFSLRPGQDLSTGNGYAEVLLTPGAFLRIGPHSQLRFSAVGLADTRIDLARGNALVEVDQFISGTHLEVTLAAASVDMLKKGLYGFAADPPAARVFDGKADVVTQAAHRDIGKHDQVALANNPQLKKSDFDENQAKQDQLYVWSAARSRTESEQNKLVAQNSAGYYPLADGWFWDPYADYYGFWGPGYWNSPFGFGFYGGFYPGFYHGFYGGRRGGWHGGWSHAGGWHGGHAFVGVHGNGVAGGFHGGGFHGGGGGHR
ncbi:MAG: hypothetical protein JO340_06410 [Acidobacteriaceae bacterium]|nr:hypothetical protein [Acidobacteriaceae bacterium]